MPSNKHPQDAIRRSALWAAYGDALGFITEFADPGTVKRRIGKRRVTQTVPWRRRVGGQFGPTAELPAGAISDDTQLRLATCRSILPDGTFDVETFSKIELTVWPSYALGAGRGSRAAAVNLTRRDTLWANNFFETRGSKYLHGGGNGAAMRIQPHIWAGSSHRLPNSLHGVLINALCTHGHPRGFLGAFFHALCLHLTLAEQRPSGPADWHRFVDNFTEAANLLQSDNVIQDLWLGPWQEGFGRPLESAISEVAEEMHNDIVKVEQLKGDHAVDAYLYAAEQLEIYKNDQRGSGTKTGLLAAVAAWIFAPDADAGVLTCANALGTDTDTIATMAGALLGSLAENDPDEAIQDADYIAHEAGRMSAIAEGRGAAPFPSVDLLSWIPPRTQSDVVGYQGDVLGLAGLGPATKAGPSWGARGREPVKFEWLKLWFGQQVLAKSRVEPSPLPSHAVVTPSPDYQAPSSGVVLAPKAAPRPSRSQAPGKPPRDSSPAPTTNPRRVVDPAQASLPTEDSRRPPPDQAKLLAAVAASRSMHELTDIVIRSGFDPEIVGAGLLKSIDGVETGIERGGAYAAIIAKARMSRRRSESP